MRVLTALALCLAAIGLSGSTAAPAGLSPHVAAPYSCVANYYVNDATGSDFRRGTSPELAWKTITHAIVRLAGNGHGGVCINVAPGTYSESLYLGSMGGSSDSATGYLVFRSIIPLQAKITLPRQYWADRHNIAIQYSSYIIFDGFEEYVENSPVAPNAGFFLQGKPDVITHHIKIINCLIHDTGSSGIAVADYTDYITASGNTIHNTAGQVNGSPLTMWQAYAYDEAPGFHNYFTNNKIYDNINLGNFIHTEGSGITMDTLNRYSYPNATLIENNVIFGNGGPCISIYKSDYVTVRFNTCYHNNQDPSITFSRGEILAAQANNTVIANNIAYASPGPPAGLYVLADDPQGQGETGNLWVNNLAFGVQNDGVSPISEAFLTHVASGGAEITAADGNILGKDPLFKSPPQDFSLKAGSPAIGVATPSHGVPVKDINNTIRAAPYDLGALAFSP